MARRRCTTSTRAPPSTGAATVTAVDNQPRPDVVIITARCARCKRTVTHGAGRLDEADGVVGSDRAQHCQCVLPGYILRDPDGVVPRRLAEIRAEAAGPRPTPLLIGAPP